MNFSFFFLLVYMSLVSFALAFLCYYFVIRIFGKEGKASKLAQIILIPLVIVAFDMTVFAMDESMQYFIASIPLAGVAGLALYAYFFKRDDTYGFAPTPKEAARVLEAPPKKVSKKSQRIHEARAKRGKK